MESCKISLFLCHKRPSLLSIEIDGRAGGKNGRDRKRKRKQWRGRRITEREGREGGREGGREEGRKEGNESCETHSEHSAFFLRRALFPPPCLASPLQLVHSSFSRLVSRNVLVRSFVRRFHSFIPLQTNRGCERAIPSLGPRRSASERCTSLHCRVTRRRGSHSQWPIRIWTWGEVAIERRKEGRGRK